MSKLIMAIAALGLLTGSVPVFAQKASCADYCAKVCATANSKNYCMQNCMPKCNMSRAK